jgi:hypothetical protein
MMLTAGQLDAASAHLDAALAIDPASLAALALREKLSVVRASGSRRVSDSNMRANAPAAPLESKTTPPASGRFVPSGVDAASWTDFEQRIQQRRFRALIETGDRAVASGDQTAARNALEEARELQPDSLEVARLSIRLATMPMLAAENAKREGLFRSRTFRAASLLLLGVSLLMGLDWVRADQPGTQSSSVASATPGGLSIEDIAVADEPSVAVAVPPATDSPDSPSLQAPVDELDNVATTGLQPPPVSLPAVDDVREIREVPSGETPDAFVALPANRLASSAVTTSPVVTGEIPDDYVAPARRPSNDARETPVLTAGRAGTPSSIANVVRQPAPVVDPLGTSAGTSAPFPAPAVSPAPVAPSAAPAAAAIVPPPNESLRVRSVLDQYARAFGRLDVSAVRAVYPSVDQRGLTRAFSDLSSQTVSFDRCDIDIDPQSGGSNAKAACYGKASFVGKVGSQQRTESRTVRFELKRDGDAWKIQKAQTGR